LASVLKLESTQGTWSLVEPMPEARRGHSACAIGSDIYGFGGRCEIGRMTSSVFKLDTEANTWSALEPMPLPCFSYSVHVLNGNQVYVIGAGDDCRGVLHFNMASGVWSALGATSDNKIGSATFVFGGCLYVAGGVVQSSDVERYDVATDTWTAVAGMLEGRDGFVQSPSDPRTLPRSRTSSTH
jgi:N-acetylneuraminic acid mutarotase